MGYTFLLIVGFIALAMVFLAIGILVKKGGKFPDGHIGHSKAMRERGITCALSTEARERKQKDLNARLSELKK